MTKRSRNQLLYACTTPNLWLQTVVASAEPQPIAPHLRQWQASLAIPVSDPLRLTRKRRH